MLRNKIYYRIKPFVPTPVRLAVRKRVALWMRSRTRHLWPIMPGSEVPPDGWAGWPNGKQFALVLTHDVEGRAGVDKCRQLMELEMELGFRSAFNFIPAGTYRLPRALRDELTANGFEVGVHDFRHDGHLFASRRDFARNAVQINRYMKEWNAKGFRAGFMLHKLDWLHDLEIEYDASTFDTDPFEPQPEGRHTIFPFWVEDRTNQSNAKRGYVELPYTLPQDSTLFILLGEETPDVWLRKLDWVAKHGGMALIDTHPDYMSFRASYGTGEYPVRLYREFLEYVRNKYADAYWPALPREVAAHVAQTRNKAATAKNHRWRLRGKRAGAVVFSHYPADPRPRRAAEALVREGVAVEVICLQSRPDEPRRERINGVDILRIPLKRHREGKLRYITQYSSFIAIAFGYLAMRSFKRRYHLIHVHNMPDVLVFSALIPKLRGAKVMLDLHDPMPELMQTIFGLEAAHSSVRMLKKLEKWSIAFADFVLTVNLACKKIYSARSCSPEKIQVVLNSPDEGTFVFQPAANGSSNGSDQPKQPFTILYHGSLVQRNGFDLAVNALDRLKDKLPDVKLLVCGEQTAFFDEVMDWAGKRGLDRHIDYLGLCNRHQIIEAIRRCDLGIVPNHRNIFTEINTPTRIFEYLALGKPVVAPDAGGIRDYFAQDDLIFFQLGDVTDLVEKIEFAHSNRDNLPDLVRRGQKVYLAHTWTKERSGFLDTVANLL